MSDVFISYKAEDRRRVQPLVQALQADGLSVWWDEHIGAGDEWRQTIEKQLDSAKCVVVIWSKRSVGEDGQFVRDEAARAQKRHIYVPITIDEVRIPLGFGESQATSLRGWRGNRSDSRYQAMLAAVHRITGIGVAEPSSPRQSNDDFPRLAVPGAERRRVGRSPFPELVRRRRVRAVADRRNLLVEALADQFARVCLRAVVAGELDPHCVFGATDLLPPLPRVHQLLQSERDQHAEHDDPDLADELAPTVQRFRKMEVQAAGPPAVTQA